MLLASLAAARENGPFVAIIEIDARTRAARPIHAPYLAVLDDERLSLAMLSRDIDGVTRRFTLMVPTEDGGFATLAGRLCRALSKSCGEGLIHYALGSPYRFVPLNQVVESNDPQFLDRLFRDRIVMIGPTQRYTDRVEVPVNLAGWERGGGTSPGVVVHAQALRTALMGAAPAETGRPVTLVLVTLAALLVLMRRSRLALVAGLLVAAGAMTAATFLLRGGVFQALSAALFTLAVALMSRAGFEAWRRRRNQVQLRAAFAGRVSAPVLAAILRGKLAAAKEAQRVEVACLAVGLRVPPTASSPAEAASVLGRLHEVVATSVHRHDGMLDAVAADGVVAVFGVPRRVGDPCRCAASAAAEIFRGVSRLNAQLAKEGKRPAEIVVAATFGAGLAGKVGARGPLAYTVIGEAPDEAVRLREEARRLGQPFLASDAFRACAGDALSDFQHRDCE
jgi:adenylate cyclase